MGGGIGEEYNIRTNSIKDNNKITTKTKENKTRVMRAWKVMLLL